MELYSKYIKEREDIDIIYDDKCFITYKKYDDNTAFVVDIFSVKEVRGSGAMVTLCDKLMDTLRSENFTVVFGQTDERTNGWENSERVIKIYGFRYTGKDPDNDKINNYYYEL